MYETNLCKRPSQSLLSYSITLPPVASENVEEVLGSHSID